MFSGRNNCYSSSLIALFLACCCDTWGQEKQLAGDCAAIVLEFSLKAGESLHEHVSDHVLLDVQADDEAKRGWRFSLNGVGGNDYISPVNPPLRFNASQILGGPAYNLTAKESLTNLRELRFLLKEADYEFIKPLWTNALWPYSASHPESAGSEYVAGLSQLQMGLLRVRILRADVSPDDAVHSAAFRFELTAPTDFGFGPNLNPHPAACPARFKF